MNLSGGSVVKHMSGPSSSACRRSGDGVSDQFPAGLRVLVVDDDPTCLRILEQMLWKCYYEVTKCNRAEVALSLLRENKNGFDIVLSDVHMPDMDGFKLLEHIGLEMDLPVIMMSADDSRSVVLNGVTHGACDYLIKPVRIEALKNIWQHVVRKKKHEWKDKDFDQSGSMEGKQQQKPPEDVECSSSANEGSWKSSKKRKEEDEAEERDDTSSLKKPRVVWSVELHQQFVQSVNQLGVDKAVPKKILEMMNVPGLTRENVASHLQKYRLYLRRLSNGSQHQNGLHNSFMGHPDDNFGAMSSFNGLDFQALAATGQLPPHSLATLQVAALNRSATKSSISVPLIDQRNLFSFENPMLRFPEGQQQLNNSNNQVDLLHGIPTTMEPKQLAKLHQSSQSFVRMNMQVNSSAQQNNSLLMRMSQPQSRAQMLNEANNGSQVSRLPLSMPQQPLSSNMMPGLSRSGIVDNARGGVYNQVSQASSTVDFSLHQNTEMQGYNFPLVSSNSEMSTLTSKRMRQDEVNSDTRGFPLDYDIFSEQHQQKTQWGLQNVGSNFNGNHNSSIQGTLDVSPSMLFQQGISSTKKNGQNKNAPIPNTVFSSRQESGHVSSMDGPQRNALLKGNLLTVKADRLLNTNYQSTIFPEQFGQEDLMSALLEQQEIVGPVGGEFGFDGYPLDNLPV